MKSIRRLVLFGMVLAALGYVVRPGQTALAQSYSADDWLTMLETLEQTTPAPASSGPKGGTYWSAQHAPGTHAPWPPLPGNSMGLDVWPLGDGVFVLNDTNVDYDAISAEPDAEPEMSPRLRMSMIERSLAGSYAYATPVYLTNMAASLASDGRMNMSFAVAGGTNFVPFDILTTTNLLMPETQWNWLGIGYTSNRYAFASQPTGQAYYLLAKPAQTMAVAWGENYFGQCDVPPGITNAVMLAGGGGYTIGLLSNGTVVGWGGRTTEGSVPTNLTGVAMIASGLDHKVVLLTNGLVEAWGDNFYGECDVPANLTNATVISAQYLHTLALSRNGTVMSWGDLESDSGENDIPAGLTNVTAIAAGGEHNLAVSNGIVVAWGDNYYHQCNVPAGLTNVWDVAAGFAHSVALKKDGTVVAWGDNTFGETNIPADLTNVVAIAAGGYFDEYPAEPYSGYTMALKKDGTVVVLGANEIAAPVSGLNHVIAINGEYDSGLAIRTGPPTPVITQEPASQMVLSGGTAVLDVSVQGAGPGAYEWLMNCAPVVSRTIATVAGGGSNFPVFGGPATTDSLYLPAGVAVAGGGGFYIADTYHQVICRVDTNGCITTVAGNPSFGGTYTGNGGAATNAGLAYPSGVAWDGAGNLYIADTQNHVIRKVGTNGIIMTVAGKNVAGYAGDGGAATNAELKSPASIALDGTGNLYIADTGNGVIRKVGTNGLITTIAGTNTLNGNYSGDGGPAILAGLSSPNGVAVAGTGNFYIADTGNNAIREVGTNGIITTVAGNTVYGFGGDGGAATSAELSSPASVALDSAGNLYIADTGNGVIRAVDANGIITTAAGTNALNGNYSGDGGPATLAGLAYPAGVAVDGTGNIYIADTDNNVIRKATKINSASETNQSITLTIPNLQTNVAGSYQLVVTNAYGSVTSSIANLIVGVRPAIVAEPASQYLLLGDTAVFNVTATGIPAPHCQWYFDSTALAGATNATLTLMNFTTNNLGVYQVAVTNLYGSVTSSVAALADVQVYAGPNQIISNATAAVQSSSLQLQGVVSTSNGQPPGGSSVADWSVVSAPTNATVTFVDASLTNAIVTFNHSPNNVGTYQLRLTVSDGQSNVSSDVFITFSLTDIQFPYGDTNYVYTYAATNDLTSFYAVTNFDGSWTNGQAGFGNGLSNGSDPCGPTHATLWPGYAYGEPWLYTRRIFNVPPEANRLNLALAIDNDAQLFLNGNLLTPSNTTFNGLVVTQNVGQAVYAFTEYGGFGTVYDTGSAFNGSEVWLTNVFWHQWCCSYNDLQLIGIATNLWHPGTNVLAVMTYDSGDASFFDSQIDLIADTATPNPALAVDAGPNKFIVWPQNMVYLNGTIIDDGWPADGTVTGTWSEVSGPDTNVAFSPTQPGDFSTNLAMDSAIATFDMPGTYRLQLTASDSLRSATGYMTVIVDDGSVAPPTVSLITPTNNATFLPGTIIPIMATASASTGVIAQVEFYANNVLIGRAINNSDNTYTMNWVNPPLGDYQLTAVAVDEAGRVNASEFIFISVNYGVYAGPNQIVTNSTTAAPTNSLQLQGVVFQSGGNPPSGPYSVLWNWVSGPPNSLVLFANAGLTNTVVTFSNGVTDVGTYVLDLTEFGANGVSTNAEVVITVTSADVVAYAATNNLYTYAASDLIADYYATNFDDSAWTNGQGGFGNGNPGCSLMPNTGWPGYDSGDPWLYVRHHFIVPVGTTNLSMGFAVDNDAQIFLNGVLLTPTNAVFNGTTVTQNIAQAIYNEGNNGFSTDYYEAYGHTYPPFWLSDVFYSLNCCAYDDLVLNGISTNVWHAGTNILAVRVYDNGFTSFFDNRISLLPAGTNGTTQP